MVVLVGVADHKMAIFLPNQRCQQVVITGAPHTNKCAFYSSICIEYCFSYICWIKCSLLNTPHWLYILCSSGLCVCLCVRMFVCTCMHAFCICLSISKIHRGWINTSSSGFSFKAYRKSLHLIPITITNWELSLLSQTKRIIRYCLNFSI